MSYTDLKRQAASTRFWLRRVYAIPSSQRKHANTATSLSTAKGQEGGDAEMEMEMSVEEAVDLSADEDEPNMDSDEEPTLVEPAESDTSTAIASDGCYCRSCYCYCCRRGSFAAASVEAKKKGWEMLGLLFESCRTAAL
jgi:hypothetical protein